MNRVIKFRAYNKNTNEIISWNEIGDDHWDLWNEFKNCDTIMQFTGLLDKNGVEIYEGDVMGSCVVKFNKGRFNLYYDYGRAEEMEDNFETYARNWAVIGNIYQHPELLKS